MEKRTKAQLAFDRAKHGWAFCSHEMLLGRLPNLRELAKELDPKDPRHDVLRQIENSVGRRLSDCQLQKLIDDLLKPFEEISTPVTGADYVDFMRRLSSEAQRRANAADRAACGETVR